MEQPILVLGGGHSARCRLVWIASEKCRRPSPWLFAISSFVSIVLLFSWPSELSAGVCEAWSEMDTVGTVLSIPITLNDILVADVMYDDGRPEVVVTVEPDSIVILEWQRDGTFTETPIELADCENPWGMEAFDLDSDGDTDFCVVCATSKTLIAMFQDPEGQFCQEVVSLSDPLRFPAAVAAGAFSDSLGGPSNLAVVLSEDPACSCLPSLRGFTTAASGRCPPVSHVLTKLLHPDGSAQTINWGVWAVESGDIVGNASSDLGIIYGLFNSDVLTGQLDPNLRESDHFGIAEFTSQGPVLRQLVNVRNEGFGLSTTIWDLAIADLTGDGNDDLMLGAGGGDGFHNFLTIRLSNGDSLYSISDFVAFGIGRPYDIDVENLDNDDAKEIAVTTLAHDIALVDTDGQGHVNEVCRKGVLGTVVTSGVGDFDLDGKQDIVVLAGHDLGQLGGPDAHVAYFLSR